jgi:hypothetical protein
MLGTAGVIFPYGNHSELPLFDHGIAGFDIKPFCRSMGAIHPERRITEPLCAHRIPPSKGCKSDLFFPQPEGAYRHSVGLRIRLERPHAIRTQVILKNTIEAGVLHRLIEQKEKENRCWLSTCLNHVAAPRRGCSIVVPCSFARNCSSNLV